MIWVSLKESHRDFFELLFRGRKKVVEALILKLMAFLGA